MLVGGLVISFLVLLLFPIGYAWGVYKKYQPDILGIKKDRTRDPRYFGKTFSKMMRQELLKNQKKRAAILTLSREEGVHYTVDAPLKEGVYEKLIVAEEEICVVPTQVILRKEMYAKYNICITGDTLLRALYAEHNMVLGNEVNIIRWVDANGTLAVYDNCKLGMSATSALLMTIGKNCKFRRLFAPLILFGQYPNQMMEVSHPHQGKVYELKKQKNLRKNISYIKEDMVDAEGVIPFTVITENDLVVTEKLIVQGDICSSKGVRLCEGAVVCGNIFAEGNILLGKKTLVLGNVFSQDSIKMQDDAVVGRRGSRSSVIARNYIIIEERARVYGYVGCEKGGTVWPLLPEENPEREYSLKFLLHHIERREIIFKSGKDYERVNELGYRHCHGLKRVVIPEGVTVIQQSMFYDCSQLEEVILPSTIEVISEYAFAGCKKLTKINLDKMCGLKCIKDHAFEGCTSLKRVALGRAVVEIGNAAFCGCSQLKVFKLESPNTLSELGTHIWIGTPLKREQINIPKSMFRPEKNLLPDSDEWEVAYKEEVSEGVKINSKALKDFECNSLTKQLTGKRNKYGERMPRFRAVRTREQTHKMYRMQLAVALMIILFVCSIGVHYDERKMRTESEKKIVENRGLYRNQGLRMETVLDQMPNQVTESNVVYEERILKRYKCSEDMLNKHMKLYKVMHEEIPKEVIQATMIVPLRIQYEESARTYVGEMQADIAKIATNIPSEMHYIDLFKVLEPYQDRYIFYRTEPYWTSEGAYYGMKAYQDTMGRHMDGFYSYEEHLYHSLTGTLYMEAYPEADRTLEVSQDKLYYYLQPKSHNWEMIYKYTKKWEYVQEPIVSKARGVLDVFVGGIYAYATMDGSVDNGKSIMVLGDKHRDMMATYLINEYEKVVLVNAYYFKSAYKEQTTQAFSNLFKKYGITDFLYIQGAGNLENEQFWENTYSLFRDGQ